MRRELVRRCSCNGPHFLSVSWDPAESADLLEAAGYFTVEGSFTHTWRERIRQAFAVLFHGHAGTWLEVVLTPGTAREIAGELLVYSGACATSQEEETSESHQ